MRTISVFFLFSILFPSVLLAETLDDLISRKAQKYQIDHNLVKAVIRQESGGKNAAVSPKGARGLMQVLPGTALQMGIDPKLLHSPEHNIEAGVRYLSYLRSLFPGDIKKVLAAYNAGPGAVMKYGGIPPYKETQKYVPAILAHLNKNQPLAIHVNSTSSRINIRPEQKTVETLDRNIIYQAINNSSKVL